MRDLATQITAGSLHYPLMINSSRDAVGELEVLSPYNERRLGSVATAGPDHIEEALATAYALHRNRKVWLAIPKRIAILEKTATLMKERASELALLAASEGGKPLSDSIVEVTRAIDGVHLCIESLRNHPGKVIALGTTQATVGRVAHTRKEPIGVVVAVSAFNHPLNLIVHQVGPAVAAGCPVIVKPAADTPFSCLQFVALLREAGLPDEWCQVAVTDDRDTAEMLVTDRRLGFFSFIGSARVGWMLRSKLAPGVRCALEHGGVAPAILTSDFDQDIALQSILKGGFYHAGQVCVSVQRVFAPREIAKEFAQDLSSHAAKLRVGDPADASTEVGPLIRKAEVDRIAEWVDEAISAGGSLLCGGKKISATCYEPTVILDPPANVRVSTEEIFGPVVCVFSYDNVDDAVDVANSLPTAFQAAVFGRDIDQAMELVQRIDASAVMINDHTAFRDDVMPFAGLRESGLGTGGIPYTLEDMQVDKMTVIRSPGIA